MDIICKRLTLTILHEIYYNIVKSENKFALKTKIKERISIMKKIIAIAMAAMLICSVFAGCGGAANSSTTETKAETEATTVADDAADEETTAASDAEFEYVGTWVVVRFVTTDGSEYGLADYAVLSGQTEEDTTIVYTFAEDGKVTCTVGTAAVEGTYTVNGTEIETTFAANSPKFEFNAETGEISTVDAATQVTTYYAKMN